MLVEGIDNFRIHHDEDSITDMQFVNRHDHHLAVHQ